jgi:hypothetical protein
MIEARSLREIVQYDPASGNLTWLPRAASDFEEGGIGAQAKAARWNKRYAHKPALHHIGNAGYRKGSIYSKSCFAHRVAWAWMMNEWPDEIDHINGNRADNRWVNLRSVDHEANSKNSSRPSNNSSGAVGVSWHSVQKCWRAYIKVNQRSIHLGRFLTFDDALFARLAAERDYGFHPNHGKDLASAK